LFRRQRLAPKCVVLYEKKEAIDYKNNVYSCESYRYSLFVEVVVGGGERKSIFEMKNSNKVKNEK
jgi:hypothetical protein